MCEQAANLTSTSEHKAGGCCCGSTAQGSKDNGTKADSSFDRNNDADTKSNGCCGGHRTQNDRSLASNSLTSGDIK